MFSLLILIFLWLIVLAFFDFPSLEISSGRSQMYCRKTEEILCGELGKFFKQKEAKEAKHPFGSTREYLCRLRCRLFKTKLVSASRRCNGREVTARLSNQHASRVCSPDFT